MMKKILLSISILFTTTYIFGQNNSGSPYSRYGIGLLPDNFGIYTAMGGVSAAMRDANCSRRKDCCAMQPVGEGGGVIVCIPHGLRILPLSEEDFSRPSVG